MRRCHGLTRVGKRCSVTSSSGWADDHGRLVAGPLQKGGEFCLFHAKPFCTRPARLDDLTRMVVIILDLETTGVDIMSDRIVEIAAIHSHSDVRMTGGCFSSTVRVDEDVLAARGREAFQVHGITNGEIYRSPDFKEVWQRLLQWIDDIKNNATTCDEFDSEDDIGAPKLLEEPVVVLAAHNGIKFDFPMLLCELLRHGLSTATFDDWYFVDTLHVFKSLNPYGCVKLQCTARDMTIDSGSAHRALDDCIVLRRLTSILAERVGIRMKRLLSFHLVDLDVLSSIAQLRTLM